MACTSTCVRPTPHQAHCGVCHETFGGVSLFDAHRSRGECIRPPVLGYQRNDRGVWRTPSDGSWAAQRFRNVRS